MKVFVVLEKNTYTDYEYCGVYATRELAEDRVLEIIKEVPKAEDGLYIEEVEI